jgi:energy-coupling factor transport system ATP-binding protein
VLVLHQGRLVLDGEPGPLLAQASERDLARYGLNLPPVVRAARAMGMASEPGSAAPLTVDAWQAAVGQGWDRTDLQQVRDALSSAGGLCPRPDRQADALSAHSSDLEPVLRTEALSFAHVRGEPLLRDVDLAVQARESLALVGANGSGKTTLIKHFNGLHRPSSGRVWVLGQDTRHTRVSRLARQVGMVFQNANDQFFKFTVRDEIEVGLRARRSRRDVGHDRGWLDALIELLHLAPLLERSPYRLSEGEKKRVAFCAALAARPEILVLDEPTTGQDWGFRRALGELLVRLRDPGDEFDHGQTTILVTHDLEFAEACAGRWVLLAQGSVLASGAPEAVMADAGALRQARLEVTQGFRLRKLLDRLSAPEGRLA